LEREQLRSALLSAVSHDFRTPLAAIAGAGSTLAESGHALSQESRKELADSIVAETDRLNRLVSNLLDMTRLEAGSMDLDREWHPLDDLVATVVRRLSHVLESHRLTIEVPRSLPLAFLDELLFHQVLVNLLENAAVHTPENSEIRITAGQFNSGIWMEIADTGLGFPRGDEERIFEKFYQGEHRKVRSGTGLGLPICRGIVELHGGKIHASNRPGGGAVFRIELPQPPQPAIAIPIEAATA
jgi:two-component system sensor histidine kinase KdpD